MDSKKPDALGINRRRSWTSKIYLPVRFYEAVGKIKLRKTGLYVQVDIHDTMELINVGCAVQSLSKQHRKKPLSEEL